MRTYLACILFSLPRVNMLSVLIPSMAHPTLTALCPLEPFSAFTER